MITRGHSVHQKQFLASPPVTEGVRPASAAVEVRAVRFAMVLAVGVVLWNLPRPEGVEPRAWRLLALCVMTVVGIVVRPLPMGSMAIVGIAASLASGTLTLNQALSGFANATLWLVMAAFAIAAAFVRTGLGARIAYRLVALCGSRTLGLAYSLALTDLVLAPAIASNTARAGGVIFPILQSIFRTLQTVDPIGGRQTCGFLTLTALHANIVTSAMFLTAIAVNPLVAQFAGDQGISITWGTWARAAVVPGLLSLAVVPLLIAWIAPPGALQTPDAPVLARRAIAGLGPMTRSEWTMAAIAGGLLTAWIVGPEVGIDSTVAALIGLAAILVTGVLSWDDFSRNHEAWNTFIWFATLVMMANYLSEFGMTSWFSNHAGGLFSGIGWQTGFLALSLTYFYTHYFFASVTAHTSAMYAPFLAVALGLGAPPVLAALVLGFFSSLFGGLTHYGTAPAPIFFGGGYVDLGTWWKVGLIVSFAEIVIWLGVGGVWWRIIGIW
jgi:DASS family divalent anion:Na+ symporter